MNSGFSIDKLTASCFDTGEQAQWVGYLGKKTKILKISETLGKNSAVNLVIEEFLKKNRKNTVAYTDIVEACLHNEVFLHCQAPQKCSVRLERGGEEFCVTD